MTHALLARHRDGTLSNILLQMIDARIAGMGAIQAYCERIRATPLPFAYTLLLHRTAYLFCILVPFGFASTLGWFTPLLAAIIAYTFFGLDALGNELEEPFGRAANDLPLDALVRTIEIDLLPAAGEPAPPPLSPVRYVLS
jgi:putative membrane protein